jgi:hypothetical protein
MEAYCREHHSSRIPLFTLALSACEIYQNEA